jgi:hypothetical protein
MAGGGLFVATKASLRVMLSEGVCCTDEGSGSRRGGEDDIWFGRDV